jgi:putative transposase
MDKMPKKSNYIKTNRSKHCLKVHLIFVCKYRKPLLINNLKEDMKNILHKVSKKSDFKIEVMESDVNHIHLLIRYIPRISISSIVQKLKQESTKEIWLLYYNSLKKEFWGEKTFWSDGYFACSIGEASSETIRNYILNQG